jgi:AcrR family transcriptional regulator
VTLFSARGYDHVTMNAIAEEANVGASTIYKYFPKKENFLMAYRNMVIEDTIAEVREYEDLEEFDLHEKLQFLIDTYLENLLEHREFVDETIKKFMLNPILHYKQKNTADESLRELINDFFDDAVEEGELDHFPFKSALVKILADGMNGYVLYWLNDESEDFSDTTKLIDLSLGMLVLMLRSGLIDKALELVGFLIKSQLMRFSESGNLISDMLSLYKGGQKRNYKRKSKTKKETGEK